MLQFIFPYLRTRTLSGPKPIPLIPENDQDKNKVLNVLISTDIKFWIILTLLIF